MESKEEFKNLMQEVLEKFTKEELAKEYQVSISTISRWESGHSIPMNFIIKSLEEKAKV